jgi:hypothetical protein
MLSHAHAHACTHTSSKVVSFGKEMLTKVQAWSESDKSKVPTLETDKDKLP